MAGAPGQGGMAGAAEQQKEHKRKDYLSSAEHMELDIDEPFAVHPVLGDDE
jgi:hypothetical protein